MINAKTILRHFLAINQERLKRTREALRIRQRAALDILPLLFHANHPTFPGYVSAKTPKGIANYIPAQRTLDAAKNLVKCFNYKRRAQPRYDIHAIFLMGSSGTIAHSEKSDFDIWLCHSDQLTTEQIEELQAKAVAIEQWAAGIDLEVHFFLMNATAFAQGKGIELSTESSGSAQHHLLLDEFYRTGLIIAGRVPIWWLVPVEHEANYNDYVHRIAQRRLVTDNDVIDFGGLPEVPAAEFFGASLWQLYKGIDSPYKSVLKIMLLEVYAASYPQPNLLSLNFKKAIHEGEKDLTRLDPYIMLYDTIAQYLTDRDDLDRLNLLRRCFYLKVNESLSSADDPKRPSWRRETLRIMVKNWGWDQEDLIQLDERHQWRIEKVTQERKCLVAALTQSYNALSEFARNNNHITSIKQDDLNTLGRKLYAAFERKPGKIDLINRGISDSIREEALSIHEQRTAKQTSWSLFRGIVNRQDSFAHTPLHRTPTAIELLCWCHLNQILDNQTVISIHSLDPSFSIQEAKTILRVLEKMFPKGRLRAGEHDAMNHSRAMLVSTVFTNICNELPQEHTRNGHCLTSNKIDALSFGGISENQIVCLDQVIQTSWHEVTCHHYAGVEGILDCLRDNLRWSSIKSPINHWVAPTSYCFSVGHGTSIARRLRTLICDVETALGGWEINPTRYILTIGRDLYLIWRDINGMQYQQLESYQELIQRLGDIKHPFSPVVFDRHTLPKDILPAIYHHHTPGKVHLYYVSFRNQTRILIIDEGGALICQLITQSSPLTILQRHVYFLHQCRYLSASTSEYMAHQPEVACFHVKGNQRGELSTTPTPVATTAPSPLEISFKIHSVINDSGQPEFSASSMGHAFSSRSLGDHFFKEIAQYIDTHGDTDPGYPLRITALDVDQKLLNTDDGPIRTQHFLNYRWRIEKRIEYALAALNEADQKRAV